MLNLSVVICRVIGGAGAGCCCGLAGQDAAPQGPSGPGHVVPMSIEHGHGTGTIARAMGIWSGTNERDGVGELRNGREARSVFNGRAVC